MQSPQSTVKNSNLWKLWHSFNYFVGGAALLAASILLFATFANYINTALISGWLYSIGSGALFFADITEWFHYLQKDCRFLDYAINFFVSAVGSLLYLVGSICLIPGTGKLDLGLPLIISGSALIVFSQSWKLIRSLNQKEKSCNQCYKEDPHGFWLDLFAGIGGLMYFSGSFVFQNVSKNAALSDLAASIYSIGGFCFFISAIFLYTRYFCNTQKINPISVVTAENDFFNR